MKPADSTTRAPDMARWGAAAGLSAWVAYGAVEQLLSVVAEVSSRGGFVVPAWHTGLTLLALGLYGAVGLVSGAAAGILVHLLARRIGWLSGGRPLRVVRGLGPLSVAGAIAASMAVHLPQSGLTALTFLILLFVAASVAMTTYSAAWFRRLSVLANPWTAGLLLIGPLWTIKVAQTGNRVLTLLSVAGALLAILAASFLLRWLWRKARNRRHVPDRAPAMRRALGQALAVGLVVSGISVLPDQRLRMSGDPASGLPPGGPATNVVWVMMDTVRADHLSLYGYGRNTSPHLSRLAAEATTYRNAIAVSDFTLSSHASYFTGLYPSWHGAHEVREQRTSRPLAKKYHTLPEILAERGYWTAAVSANYAYLAPHFQLDHGFQHYEAFPTSQFLRPSWPFFVRNVFRPFFMAVAPPLSVEARKRDAANLNSSVFRLLRHAREKNRRFFLFINYMEAHRPYLPPPPYDTLYPGKDRRFSWSRWEDITVPILTLKAPVVAGMASHLVSQYDGAIAYLDSQLGRLFQRLRDLDLYDDCLLIVTSDHGEAFGYRNLIEHHLSVYQDQVHVPLIIKFPRRRESAWVDDFVSGADLMPTVLDVLGIQPPAELQGRSLFRPSSRTTPLIAEEHPADFFQDLHPRFRGVHRAIFSGPMKFLEMTGGGPELYDLSRDAGEERNLFQPRDPVANRLKTELDVWVRKAPRHPAARVRMAPGTRERLKSLGYLQ